ncbi:glycerol kinase [Vibrio cortegadensis]|uniref:glycerol kinase n=1 Tax=Vibrio cortegadensis TaxID=1328770 RepID=UPI00352C1D40
MSEKISTSALARLRDIEPKQLFSDLKKAGYIVRVEDKWILTEQGEKFGGEFLDHPKFGPFIIWPSNLIIDMDATTGQLQSATQLGERFKLNAKKINQLLSELGWIKKTDQGWEITSSGFRVGGEQREDKASESLFALWHDSILRNKRLKQSVIEFLGQDAETHATDKSISSFRQKFEAKHRTLDGHYVRSTDELIIDNWLYMAGVVHAYERQLPINEDVISDFYIPAGKVYLQYWGSETSTGNSEARAQKKAATLAIYQKHDFNLIELFAEDIPNLDTVLPPALRKFGIKAY